MSMNDIGAELSGEEIDELLEITSEKWDGFTLMTVRGEIDNYSAKKLRETLRSLIDEGNSRFLINLDDVSFIDSTGLGVLSGTQKRLEKTDDGFLGIVCTKEKINKLFQLTGIAKHISMFASVDDFKSQLSKE